MKSKLISAGLLSGLLFIGGISTAMAANPFSKMFHHKHHQTKTKTPVTIEQAQVVALKKVPGTVDDSKTDTVKGKQMYWFEIADAKGMKSQVWVNTSGKVTKVTKEKMAKPMKAKTT